MSRSWWGEATDEPGGDKKVCVTTAREDARPTDDAKLLRVADPRSVDGGARPSGRFNSRWRVTWMDSDACIGAGGEAA